jgi:hypothetical protein
MHPTEEKWQGVGGNGSAAATGAIAQAMVQAKTKGRGSKQDGKILTVVAIHKKRTDVVADSPDCEMDGKSITINMSRANPSRAGG